MNRQCRICHSLIMLLMVIISSTGTVSAAVDANVSINMHGVPLQQVFAEIERQTPYRFSYKSRTFDRDARSVTVECKNTPVTKALDMALKGTGLSYEVVSNKSILIKENKASRSQSHQTIKGRVTDSQGEPVTGASVTVAGSSQGVSTDINGRYTLNNVQPGKKVRISFIGMHPVTFTVSANRSTYDFTLNDNTSVLNEVVVVGYGTQKRANLTGAVATISADDVNNRPVASAANALQGADPSVNLTFNTGSPDADYAVDIRGVASVNGGSPLTLCDGVEVNLKYINPNDIESISVLKDASASAIYGAKASSGVILITTKSGLDTGGKASVSYNGRMGWRQNTTSTDFIHNGYDHVSIVNQFYEINKGQKMWGYTDEEMQMLYDRRNDVTENPDLPWAMRDANGKLRFYANFDWYNYFYRKTRPETEHNVSITGGTKKLNYFVSGRFLSQDGIFNIYHDRYQNYSFRAKLNAQLFSFVRFSTNINFNSTSYKYAGHHQEQRTISVLQSNINSAVMPFTPEGKIVQYVNTMTGANSPLGSGHGGFLTANESRNYRGTKDIVITNQLDFDITRDLVLTGSYAYRYHNGLTTYRNMPFDYEDKNGVMQTFTSGTVLDFYQELHNNVHRHSINLYATYNHKWNNAHNLTAVAGMQFEDDRNNTISIKQNDLLSKDLSSFSVATGPMYHNQTIQSYRTLGYFARANYDYEGKYLLEASGRIDGTSRFAAKDRWGFFPSASVGWRMSQEKFWEPLSSVWNNSKFRFSIGSLGNQQVAPYAYFDQVKTNNIMSYTFNGTEKAKYASVSAPKSSALTWETVTTYNWGLDLGFLNNRLSATADIYIRDTKDMLTQSLTLPAVYGAPTPNENCADLRTNGWEIYLNWKDGFNLGGHRFSYGVSATLGDYITKITKFNNPDKVIGSPYVGMVMGELWGYKVAGLFPTDEAAAAYQARVDDSQVNNQIYNSKRENKLQAGDVEFIDLDENGVISSGSGTVGDSGDARVVGNSLPRYSYSFRLNAEYFGFDVAAFFQGVGKRDWYPSQNAYDFWGPYSFPSLSFIHKDFMENTWSEENPGAYFPRPRGYSSYSGGALGAVNDRYMQNAAYLRLKNLTIGYTVPLKNTKVFKHIRVYFTGENLFYWSPLKKWTKTVDPELATASGTLNASSGVGYGFSRTFSVGLDVKF